MPSVALALSFLYVQLFPVTINSDNLIDAIFGFLLAGVVYVVILLFQKTIEYWKSRIPLLTGWSIIFVAAVDSALVQLVQLSNPYNYDILTVIAITFHESPSVTFGVGGICIIVGLYYWTKEVGTSKIQFESALTALPVGLAVTDLDGRVILHNTRLLKILDLSAEELQNADLSDVFDLDLIQATHHIREAMDEPLEMEVTFEIDDAVRKYLSIGIEDNLDGVGNCIGHIVTVSDVTSNRIAEEEREQGRRVIDLYGSLLSHDIGNDLQAVMGYFEGAMLLMNVNQEKAMEMLQAAEAAGERMSKLIKTFKIESGPFHIDIVPMLREAAVRAEKASMGLKVHLDAEEDTLNLRSSGGSFLPVAIDNLLRNVDQHAGECPEVRIRVFTENDRLVLILSDNGCGIPHERQRYLFHRGDPSREHGFGLYMTQQLVIACGGTIELANSDSKTGTTFKISLPIIE
jgi:PAS domain S-box-containing protein